MNETALQLTVFVCDSCGYARVAWSHSQRPAECINHHPLREVEYVPRSQLAEREAELEQLRRENRLALERIDKVLLRTGRLMTAGDALAVGIEQYARLLEAMRAGPYDEAAKGASRQLQAHLRAALATWHTATGGENDT